jgi:hypothetical protein
MLAIDTPHFHLQGVFVPYIYSLIVSTALEKGRLIIHRLSTQ